VEIAELSDRDGKAPVVPAQAGTLCLSTPLGPRVREDGDRKKRGVTPLEC
jgi:hypothetical protein